jgi:hypothetical protein
MDIHESFEKEFEDWYATEGIRTPVPNGEHFHEYYQRIAYMAGVKAGASRFKETIDLVERAFRKQ